MTDITDQTTQTQQIDITAMRIASIKQTMSNIRETAASDMTIPINTRVILGGVINLLEQTLITQQENQELLKKLVDKD